MYQIRYQFIFIMLKEPTSKDILLKHRLHSMKLEHFIRIFIYTNRMLGILMNSNRLQHDSNLQNPIPSNMGLVVFSSYQCNKSVCIYVQQHANHSTLYLVLTRLNSITDWLYLLSDRLNHRSVYLLCLYKVLFFLLTYPVVRLCRLLLLYRFTKQVTLVKYKHSIFMFTDFYIGKLNYKLRYYSFKYDYIFLKVRRFVYTIYDCRHWVRLNRVKIRFFYNRYKGTYYNQRHKIKFYAFLFTANLVSGTFFFYTVFDRYLF